MIPIRNVYYLLLYAWNALEESDTETVAALPETQILDLLAAVLNGGVDRLLRQGLHRAYLCRQERIPAIRGKLDLARTIKDNLLRYGQTFCHFDELSHDILHNRILKATIGNLLRTDRLDAKLHDPLRTTWHRLHGIADVPLTKRTFHRVQFHRNNSLYRFLIDICRLLYDCLIPDRRTGQFVFRDFLRDERRTRILFERFIRNFYRRHAEGWDVQSEAVRWQNPIGSLELCCLGCGPT